MNNNNGQPTYVITDADKKRAELIHKAWQAYDGETEAPLQKMPGEPDDNVLSNRMRPIVDRGVDFLFGKEMGISVEENAPDNVQEFIDEIWGIREKRIPLLQKLAMSGAITGQAFIRIVPNASKQYNLVVIDPSTVYAQTETQDCEDVCLFCIQYQSEQGVPGSPKIVFYREEIKRIDPDDDDTDQYTGTDTSWEISHWSKIGERGNWQMVDAPIQWPYPFPPLFSCQNLPRPHSYWGIPDVTPDLIGVNNALNLVQSCANRVMKLFGSPILYATGAGESIIDIKPGKIIALPMTESKIVAVPLVSDIPSAIAFAADLRSDIDEQSSTPGVATGRIATMPRGALSGVAIELLFMPLLKKTEKKRCTYGSLIIDVTKALLKLNHMDGTLDLTLAWQDPLPNDDLGAVQAAIGKLQIGVSQATLQEELGYAPDEELAKKQSQPNAPTSYPESAQIDVTSQEVQSNGNINPPMGRVSQPVA